MSLYFRGVHVEGISYSVLSADAVTSWEGVQNVIDEQTVAVTCQPITVIN
jgi:hypothetical protein